MTNRNQQSIEFQALNRKIIQGAFSGGDITSDAGVLLLRAIDKKLGLTKSINDIINDPRNPQFIKHTQLSLLRQRIYSIALGYEDLNDHTQLRNDTALQTAIEEEKTLASVSTLCRLENRITDKEITLMHEVLIETFIKSFTTKPEELILDFDATDDRVHGNQEGKFFHGYYDHYCFLPLYVFCKDQLLVSYLRPSNIDGAKHAWAILSLLVKRLKKQWPDVEIIFRGDGGFCRHKMLDWCDSNDIKYIVGMAKNNVLKGMIEVEMEQMHEKCEQTNEPQRCFKSLKYGARSWKKQRTIVAKIEHLPKGANPRFIVTNLSDDAQYLYEDVYCARGDMENRIKEQQLGLFADRTSASNWWANQFRLMLSSIAYVLMENIRTIALKGTEFAKSQMTNIRLKLFKIGAVIVKNTRRIKFMFSSSYPWQQQFMLIANRLNAT